MIDKYIQNIEHIGLPSENIDYAIEFYSNIGFKLINTEYVAAKGQRVAFMQIGETQLEIYEEKSGFHGCGSINHIALGVHDVDRLFEEAKANGAAYTINTAKEDLEEMVKQYTGGRGTTVSIDAACIKDSLMNLLKVTGNAGRVMTMGFSTAATEVNQFLITSKELDVRGSRLQNRMFGKAIELIQEGKLDLNGSASHTFPIDRAQEAFDFADTHDPSIRKIVFTF